MISYRRQWWGAEGKKQPKLTWDFFHCGKLFWVCLQMWMLQAHPKVTVKELRWSDPRVSSRTRGVGESSGNGRPFMLQPVLPTLMSRHGHSSFHHLPLSCFSASLALHSGVMVSTFMPVSCRRAESQRGGGGGGADGADGMWFNSFFKNFENVKLMNCIGEANIGLKLLCCK